MDTTHIISVAQVGATAFVGIVAGFITWKMQSKQIDIAKGLQEIARAQHETAATKLRLELFEKRFKAYENLVISIEKIYNYDNHNGQMDILRMYEEFKRARAPIRYLFDESVFRYLKDEVTVAIRSFLLAIEKDLKDNVISKEDFYSIEKKEYRIVIARSFNKLEKMIGPTLHVEKQEEKPLIEQDNQSRY